MDKWPSWLGWLAAGAALTAAAAPCAAQATLDPTTLDKVGSLTRAQVAVPAGARFEIEIGALDPRLRLAPCAKVTPYLPAGQRLWGRTRVGLRCTQGPVAWNVYLPLTVHVYAQAVVAAAPLPAGAELGAMDLRLAEVDIAASNAAFFDDPRALVGRRLATALAPMAPVRADHLKVRQWFAAGDPVTITARGAGFAVSAEGQALSPGLEGQAVRVRTEGGRIVMGMPVAVRRVEMQL